MSLFKPQIILEAIENGIGTGPLTLFIGCTECGANFELNKPGLIMAIGMEAKLLDYIRYIQTSSCPACERKKEKENNYKDACCQHQQQMLEG